MHTTKSVLIGKVHCYKHKGRRNQYLWNSSLNLIKYKKGKDKIRNKINHNWNREHKIVELLSNFKNILKNYKKHWFKISDKMSLLYIIH